MTRHTPDFLRARSSNLSLRSVALEQSMAMRPEVINNKVHAKDLRPEDFTKPYLEFMTGNPTVFHAVDYFKEKLVQSGYKQVGVCTPLSPTIADSLVSPALQPRQLGREARARRQVLHHPQRQLHHCLRRRQGLQARQWLRHDRRPHRRPHRALEADEHQAKRPRLHPARRGPVCRRPERDVVGQRPEHWRPCHCAGPRDRQDHREARQARLAQCVVPCSLFLLSLN